MIDPGMKAILRIDDIQAYAYSDISAKMIEDAKLRNFRLVLGVIPKDFSEDKSIVRILKRNICNLELAIHGWDHGKYQAGEEYEFEDISEEEARIKIKEAETILQKISGKKPVTFIPPGNKISKGAARVLEEEGVRYLSADYTSSEYGMTATTFDFAKNELISNDEIFRRCEESFGKNKDCVIVLHPQDYLTDEKIDPEKYAQYENLLDGLRLRGVLSITFSDLDPVEESKPRDLPIFLQTDFRQFR